MGDLDPMMADDAKRLVRYLLSRLRKSAWESSSSGCLRKDFRSLPGRRVVDRAGFGEEEWKIEFVFMPKVD